MSLCLDNFKILCLNNFRKCESQSQDFDNFSVSTGLDDDTDLLVLRVLNSYLYITQRLSKSRPYFSQLTFGEKKREFGSFRHLKIIILANFSGMARLIWLVEVFDKQAN